MSDFMQDARELVRLENEIKTAVDMINKASSKLMTMDKNVKLTGWDYNRANNDASICVQTNLGFSIKEMSERK